MNLAELSEKAVERLGEYMSLDFDGQQFTNVQLLDFSRRLQRGFSGLGMARGSNIVLCLMNHALIYPVFGGISRSGATAIPVMFMLAAPELRYILMDSKAEGVVTDQLNIEKVKEGGK